jgi:hypothetical protein
MPPLGRVVDEAHRGQGLGEELTVGSRFRADVGRGGVAGALALLRVGVHPGSHVELLAVGGDEGEVDGGAGAVRGNLRWRYVSACGRTELFRSPVGVVAPKFVGVPLEVRTLQGGWPVSLDEQQTDAVRQQLLCVEEPGQDPFPQVSEGP